MSQSFRLKGLFPQNSGCNDKKKEKYPWIQNDISTQNIPNSDFVEIHLKITMTYLPTFPFLIKQNTHFKPENLLK